MPVNTSYFAHCTVHLLRLDTRFTRKKKVKVMILLYFNTKSIKTITDIFKRFNGNFEVNDETIFKNKYSIHRDEWILRKT